jgi:carboxypeptidase Taq
MNAAALAELSHKLMHCQLAIYRAEWDLEADPNADKPAALRAMVKAQLTFHALCSAPELGQLPANTGDALVDELRRLHAHARGIDLSTVETAAGAALRALQAWHGARAADTYDVVAEPHANVIALQRQMAGVKADNLSELYGRTVTPYEALIDAYDPGRTLAFIKTSFADVAATCRTLLQKNGGAPVPFYNGVIDEQQQASLCHTVMVAMGYDAAPPRGQLGVSTHPMCRRVAAREVWLTNRYDDRNFTSALMNIIHEGGHGRYYQGLPAARANDWLGGVAGETVNEGMALFAEQIMGRSAAFCAWVAPHITSALGIDCSTHSLYADLTAVTHDPIRAEAREVIYPLHLLLRVDIEEQLINNAMSPADLPAYWNAQSAALLGITPPDDLTGCLQDIHPYVGYIGYFPCYLLGFMVAAQVGAAIRAAHPDIERDWAQGDFARTNAWLATHIYGHGRTLTPDALVARATGAPLGPQALIAHLQERYARG